MLLAEKDVFTRLHRHLQAHNEVQTCVGYRIRLGVLKTLEIVTAEYIRQFRRVIQLPEWADSDQFPSIRFSNHRIAELGKCSGRTIYNHLTLLEKAGLVRKVWHGRQQDYELWISEWIIVGEAVEQPLVVDLKTATSPHFSLDRRQSLPPKISCDTKETTKTFYNRTVDAVENSSGELSSLLPHQLKRFCTKDSAKERESNQSAGDALDAKDTGGGGAVPPNHPRKSVRERQSKGSGSDTRVTPTDPASPGLLPDLVGYQRNLTRTFWQIAREKLYPDEYFSEKHTNQIHHLLYRDVFMNGFNGIDSEKRSMDLYLARLNQLGKAERWMRKTKWSGIMPPKCYFSYSFHKQLEADGKKGNFHYTTAWQIADEKAQRKQDLTKLLNTAVASVSHIRPPQGLKDGKHMTRISLYQYWENRLRKCSDADLMDRYYDAMAHVIPRSSTAVITS